MNLPTFNTDASNRLCEEIAKKSKRVCFAMCSGGKDSVAMLLQLRRYFDRIIPFFCASIPHLTFKDKYLDYLEYEFNTKILRLMGEDLKMALVRWVYQESPWECDWIDEHLEVDDYNKIDILNYLRKEFNLPRAWCAVGISANDSIDRRIYCNKTGGRNDSHRTFYPCWDWPKAELLGAIRDSGLKLSSEYRYAKRSIGGVPCATYNRIMKRHYPKDFEKVLKWYPLAEAKNFREDMIEQHWKELQRERIKAKGGLDGDSEVAGGEGGEGQSEAAGGEES